ncbi:MAG: chemotaxis protein CheB [Desulfovibrionales bacterium]
MAKKKVSENQREVVDQDRKPRKEADSKPGKDENSRMEPGSEAAGRKGRDPHDTLPVTAESASGEEPHNTDEDFPVVGIGASAGGLHALENFFELLPEDPGLAFIVVQHLAPDRKSLMGKILSRKTSMQVRDAQHGTKLARNTVYTKPSDRDVLVSNWKIKLVERDKDKALPVDQLFRSMADDLQEKAIGVILSGSGSDGTLGIKEIKGAGGMVMVQDPEEAEYSGMPESAKLTGQFDFLLTIREMPRALLKYLRHPYHRKGSTPEREEPAEINGLNRILKVVHSGTGHNFTQYKKSTIKRRIARRMAVNGIDSLSEYSQYLRLNSDEVDALFRDLIINVTSFFRDKGAFETLKEKAVAPLVDSLDEDDLIRVWVPGCATGEEAYTIGMLFIEAMDERNKRLKVKIFGSDINPDSIAAARDARFPVNIAKDVDPGRLKRFFVKVNGKYRVENRLREMMIFALHDITRDPPFSKVDLVSCRNLLIYMESDLQKKILPMLHYSLKPGGYLFLGTSESVGKFTELFSPVDKKWKLFRVEDGEFKQQFDFTFGGRPSPEQRFRKEDKKSRKAGIDGEQDLPGGQDERKSTPGEQWKNRDMRQLMEQTMLARFAPAGVIVDSEHTIRFFHGDTSSFLRPPNGEPRFDILGMARSDLRPTISAGLNKARTEKRQVTYENVGIRDNEYEHVDISFVPLTSSTMRQNIILVTFAGKKADAAKGGTTGEGGASDSRVADMEQELYSLRQNLQATIEELETSNEELKSSNEELQANNEELQSTNEELDTSREELQSTNEELETVNVELQRKNEELESINDDIRNMFAHTSIGTVILDTDLRVKRFTLPATRIFNLIDKDIGRKLSDIATKLDYEFLEQDAHTVLDSLNKRELEVSTRDGRWFILRMFPYRTSDNVIQGVVINFTNITDLKNKEQEAQEAKLQAEAILETTRQPLLVLNSDLNVVSANHAFYETFQVEKKKTEGSLFYSLGNTQWNIPEFRKLLEEIIPKNASFKNYEVVHDFPNKGRKQMLVDARRIDRGEDRPYLVLVGFEEKM